MNKTKNFYINNQCAVFVKTNKTAVEAMFPANLIMKEPLPEMIKVYNYIKPTLNINSTYKNHAITDVNDYVVRIMIYQDICKHSTARGLKPALMFHLSDKIANLTLHNMLDLNLDEETLDKEAYVIDNLQSIFIGKFEHLRKDVQEGCKLLFDCYSTGDL